MNGSFRSQIQGTVIAKVSDEFKNRETGEVIPYFQVWVISDSQSPPQKMSVTKEVFDKCHVVELPKDTLEVETSVYNGKGKIRLIEQKITIKKVSGL
jgi:hypothetical protein